MRFLIDLLNRMFPAPKKGRDWLYGTEGEGLTEYQKGSKLMALTLQSGWPLLKGIFNGLIIRRCVDHGDDKKNAEYSRGVSKGLGMALKALQNIENTDLDEMLREQRLDEKEREKREAAKTRKEVQ